MILRKNQSRGVDNLRSNDAPEDVKTVGREKTPNAERWKLHEVVYNEGNNGYSVAIGTTPAGERVCAIRWNGKIPTTHEDSTLETTGTPAQGNQARWFVLPAFSTNPFFMHVQKRNFMNQ